jgi:hypothetical protein
MRHLWAILLISAATLPFSLGMSSVGVAQSSEPQPRFSDDGPPPGGCTPIGVTVSGEIVFPMTCKDFIERHKAKDRASTAAEAETKPPEASKAPDAIEAGKAAATGEASKAPDAVEADKALTTGEASKAADALQADKASATGEATNRAPAKADVSGAPAAAEASTAPTAADPGKPDEKDAKPAAAAKAAADVAAPPGTRQAAVAPATEDTVKSSAEPATTAAVSKRTRARNRVAGSPGCTRFRTYDAASATYRDFGGHRRSCP